LGTNQHSEAAPGPEESLDADDSIYKATSLADHRKGRRIKTGFVINNVWLRKMRCWVAITAEAKELIDYAHGLREPIVSVVHHIHSITIMQY